jgi:hypothetical protein
MSDAPATPAVAAPVEDELDEPLPTCRCGTDRDSKFCLRDNEYSFVRTLYLLWGGTSIPIKVSFRCVKCGKTFDSTTDPAECRLYVK